MNLTRDGKSEVLAGMARAYSSFLVALPWDDPIVIAGANEGRNKFLSNVYLHLFPKRKKYELTQLITPEARTRLEARVYKGLVFEHLVPKKRYIQVPCEERARAGTLNEAFIMDLLRRYWVLAMVTSEEDRRLSWSTMPGALWDEIDVVARYDHAGIALVPNPFVAPGVPAFRGQRTAPQRQLIVPGGPT